MLCLSLGRKNSMKEGSISSLWSPQSVTANYFFIPYYTLWFAFFPPDPKELLVCEGLIQLHHNGISETVATTERRDDVRLYDAFAAPSPFQAPTLTPAGWELRYSNLVEVVATDIIRSMAAFLMNQSVFLLDIVFPPDPVINPLSHPLGPYCQCCPFDVLLWQ